MALSYVFYSGPTDNFFDGLEVLLDRFGADFAVNMQYYDKNTGIFIAKVHIPEYLSQISMMNLELVLLKFDWEKVPPSETITEPVTKDELEIVFYKKIDISGLSEEFGISQTTIRRFIDSGASNEDLIRVMCAFFADVKTIDDKYSPTVPVVINVAKKVSFDPQQLELIAEVYLSHQFNRRKVSSSMLNAILYEVSSSYLNEERMDYESY